MSHINPKIKFIKKAINKSHEAGFWGLSRYSFSPYEACQHACKYCDGRSEKYYVDGDFEKDIVIRENLAECLQKEIPKLREKGLISIGSGITDPYQPIERETEIMKQASTVLAKNNYPVSVLTKSALIQRDLDNWVQVNKNSKFILYMTITFLEENLREIFEPNASSINDRLETLVKFKEKGCSVGVLLMPIIPLLADSKLQLKKLVKKLKEIGVDFAIPGTLTLRPGKQKDLFLQIIEKNFPDKLEQYKVLYRENRESGAAINSYSNLVYKRVIDILMVNGIPTLPDHKIYRQFMPNYDEISVLLKQMKYFYEYRGIDVRRLKKASKRYHKWLNNEKSVFRRKRSLPNCHLEETFLNAFDFGEMEEVLANKRLYSFIKQVVFNGKIFNPINLKLS